MPLTWDKLQTLDRTLLFKKIFFMAQKLTKVDSLFSLETEQFKCLIKNRQLVTMGQFNTITTIKYLYSFTDFLKGDLKLKSIRSW